MPLGRRVLVAALSSWSRGALQGPGRRMPSHSQYCFHVKDNTFVVGFRLGRPPGKQQGPGSQRLPSPALPDLHWRAGCQNGLRAFLSIGAVGLVCAARRAFQVPLQTAAPRSSVRAIGETGLRGGAAQLGSGGIVGVFAQKAFAHPIMLPRKGEYIGCGFQAPETPSKERAQGARGSPSPLFPTSSGGLAAKTPCVAFLSKGAVGLVLLREERFLSLCRLQGPGTRLVPLGSWGLGAEWHSFTRGVVLGQGRRRSTHVQSCFPVKENT